MHLMKLIYAVISLFNSLFEYVLSTLLFIVFCKDIDNYATTIVMTGARNTHFGLKNENFSISVKIALYTDDTSAVDSQNDLSNTEK